MQSSYASSEDSSEDSPSKKTKTKRRRKPGYSDFIIEEAEVDDEVEEDDEAEEGFDQMIAHADMDEGGPTARDIEGRLRREREREGLMAWE